MRRFVLNRTEDESGVSGTGVVAEGVMFTDGTCVLHWIGDVASTGVYRCLADIKVIHGHGGKTGVEFLD